MVKLLSVGLSIMFCSILCAQQKQGLFNFSPGELWPDTDGRHINAHGGGVLFHEGTYYWFGEHKGSQNNAYVGVTCYSSKDLYNWENEGVALSVSDGPGSEIARGCIMERPKVIYNFGSGKFVMWFHLELKGSGYGSALTGVAISDYPNGPYKYLRSFRPNAGQWPVNFEKSWKKKRIGPQDLEGWTEEWYQEVKEGLFVRNDFKNGQMSRDMTVFVDDNGKAYHIHSAEENLTLHISELTDDYLGFTGKYMTLAPGGHNEAPAIFKQDGMYYLITSGCTGWDPNAARSFRAKSIWGPWETLGNPCLGDDANLTFYSQGTFILPVVGKKGAFIFMADRWKPDDPIDGRYVWLPLDIEENKPVIRWHDQWSLAYFDKKEDRQVDGNIERHPGYELVWSDEFDKDGVPDSSIWSHEYGFVRNNELQWYQPENARVSNGLLLIEGRREQVVNPSYDSTSRNWRKNRRRAEYTSSSINTQGKKSFRYGIFEVKARIDTAKGMWPAIWTLGIDNRWPANGEIDMMEFYRIDDGPTILANAAWSDKNFHAVWDGAKVPLRDFIQKDPEWAERFHIWKMDWSENHIKLYLDDQLINQIDLDTTLNADGFNPFHQPHYILLNLAIGSNGGSPSETTFPRVYEVDYVRVYQKRIN